MGYEEEIPPLPTRNDELAMIQKYANEFIAQPSYKIYQNESGRQRSLEHAAQFNDVKKHYWLNFCLGAMIAAPVVYFSASFFQRSSSGVPFYYRPKYYFIDPKTYNQAKRIKTILIQIPLWIGLGLFYASRYTDSSFLHDEHLDNYHTEKML